MTERIADTTSSAEAPGVSTAATPVAFSSSTSWSGTMPPTTTGMSDTHLAQLRHDQRRERHVRARQHRQPDRVDVLVDGRGRDRVGRLEQPGVDHLEAGVAQDARHDLHPAVVSVETDLGDQDALTRHAAAP